MRRTLPGPSPQQWVDGVVAATEAAGTAHLESTVITSSPNPDLRSSAAGSGVVDFAAGTFRVDDVQHQIEWTTGPGGNVHPLADTSRDAVIGIG